MPTLSYPAEGRRSGNRRAAPKTASGLACRTVIVAGIALAGALLGADATQAKARPCSPFMKEQECCSRAGCSGHVLGNNASAKECKRTFRGKSWHPAWDGEGEAVCKRLSGPDTHE